MTEISSYYLVPGSVERCYMARLLISRSRVRIPTGSPRKLLNQHNNNSANAGPKPNKRRPNKRNLAKKTPWGLPTPAGLFPIRHSVQHDHVVCLESGYRSQVLRRHLRMAHGLEPAAYRVRWKLPADHPITAPAYSERRSTMAKEIGLGRGLPDVAVSTPAPEVIAPPPAKRRGRKPRVAVAE